MKKFQTPLLTSLAALTVIGCASHPIIDRASYEEVSFAELTANLEAYEGRKVVFLARALPTSHGLWLLNPQEDGSDTICPAYSPHNRFTVPFDREKDLARKEAPLVTAYGVAQYQEPPDEDEIIVSSGCLYSSVTEAILTPSRQ